MKPFNLEEYLAKPSRKVITRDGRKARVICTDAKNNYPIVALVETQTNDEEHIFSFTKYGGWSIEVEESINDLFFAPEKKEGWVNILGEVNGGCYVGHSRIFNSKEKAEEKGKSYCNYVATVKIEWEE